MGKRATKKEVERRVQTLAKLIVEGANCVELQAYGQREWGLCAPQVSHYINQARQWIREQSDIDRPAFVSAKLAQLEKIAREAAKAGQHNNAIGALRLMSEMVGVLK